MPRSTRQEEAAAPAPTAAPAAPARRSRQPPAALLALLILGMLAFLAISRRLIILQVLDAGSLDQAAARRAPHHDRPAGHPRPHLRPQPQRPGHLDPGPEPSGPTPPGHGQAPHTAARLAGALSVTKARLAERHELRAASSWPRRIPKFRGDIVQRMNLPGIYVVADVAIATLGHGRRPGPRLRQHRRPRPGRHRAAGCWAATGQDPAGAGPAEPGHPPGPPQPRASRARHRPGPHHRPAPPVRDQADLDRAVRDHGAKAGSVVVMSPRTGEVLAMANVPAFDPNRIAGSKAEARKGRAIADMFEPGSTNKTITAAARPPARRHHPEDRDDRPRQPPAVPEDLPRLPLTPPSS